jgi:N-acetylmuramoyl-L-alanine amidase
MSTVFISPSSKEYKLSPITEKSEAEVMRKLAEEIKESLSERGIEAIISPANSSPSQSVIDSNSSKVALHLTLTHLRADSPLDRGIQVIYESTDGKSRDYAQMIAQNIKGIYPLPDLVKVLGNGSFVELTNTDAPSVVLALTNQANEDDALWLDGNLEKVAQNVADSIAEALDEKPTPEPLTAIGIINSTKGYATVRKSPSPTSKVLMRIQNGSPVRIIGKLGSWYAIIAAKVEGYVLESDVTAETPEG